MPESPQLASARKHLGLAEADYRSRESLACLEEGLALLEEIALDGTDEEKAIATNLLRTYAERICDSVRKVVQNDPGLPEPELEHLLRVLLAFDSADLELPRYVRSLKVDIAKRLIDRYYEGHTAEEKQKALQQLAGIVEPDS